MKVSGLRQDSFWTQGNSFAYIFNTDEAIDAGKLSGLAAAIELFVSPNATRRRFTLIKEAMTTNGRIQAGIIFYSIGNNEYSDPTGKFIFSVSTVHGAADYFEELLIDDQKSKS